MNIQKISEMLENPEKLPPAAYSTLPSDPKRLIMVLKGESGYYGCGEFDTEEQAKQARDRRNEILGVSIEEREALTILSMRLN